MPFSSPQRKSRDMLLMVYLCVVLLKCWSRITSTSSRNTQVLLRKCSKSTVTDPGAGFNFKLTAKTKLYLFDDAVHNFSSSLAFFTVLVKIWKEPSWNLCYSSFYLNNIPVCRSLWHKQQSFLHVSHVRLWSVFILKQEDVICPFGILDNEASQMALLTRFRFQRQVFLFYKKVLKYT